MTLLAELAAASIAIALVLDGLRKLLHAEAFTRWLHTGGLTRLARRELVYLLAAIEVAVGIASVHPFGRLLAIGVIVLVTPIGARLVRRTGVCACRGVVRSSTATQLLVRNTTVVLIAAATLVVLHTPLALSAVLIAGSAWVVILIGRHVLLTRAPLEVAR